jgi:hypothetical protein
MELWLLGAGAIVLIGITLWIVWPGRIADAVGTTVLDEEETPMTQYPPPGRTPQGSAFEDQYTSATADLSAGGVAAAVDSMRQQGAEAAREAGEPWPVTRTEGERRGFAFPRRIRRPDRRDLTRPKTISLSAGAVMSMAGAIGGAWLLNRWQRERNKPINRLRRGALGMAHRFGDRLPEVEDLPRTAPIGGAASALILSGLVLSRVRRRPSDAERATDLGDQARALIGASMREAFLRGRDVMERGRESPAVREALERGRGAIERGRPSISVREAFMLGRATAERDLLKRARKEMRVETSRKGPFLGLGFGGLAVVLGGGYLIWRLLRGSRPSPSPNWYDTGA